MSTVAPSSTAAEQRERLFFLCMAVAIAVTVVFAFGMWFVIGNSSFAAPWWVHVHAVSFMAWIGLYLTQNLLVFRNDLTWHRRIGRIGGVVAAAMVLIGLVVTATSLALHRFPPFFTPAFFLALDWMNMVVFGGLVVAGLVMRARTDWHRRLMLCATISVMAPAWGRILVWQHAMTAWTNVAALLGLVSVAMIADWRIRGSVHRAYFWGFGAIVGWGALVQLLSQFPPFVALAERIAS